MSVPEYNCILLVSLALINAILLGLIIYVASLWIKAVRGKSSDWRNKL